MKLFNRQKTKTVVDVSILTCTLVLGFYITVMTDEIGFFCLLGFLVLMIVGFAKINDNSVNKITEKETKQ